MNIPIWQKTPQNEKTSDKPRIYSQPIYKELNPGFIKNSHRPIRKKNHPNEKGLNGLKKHFCEKRKPRGSIKKSPVSGLIMKMQIKTRIRCCFTFRDGKKSYFWMCAPKKSGKWVEGDSH